MRMIGVLMIACAFVAPCVLIPLLPVGTMDRVAMSYGMQGPAMIMGVPLIALMIQGLRLVEGDV